MMWVADTPQPVPGWVVALAVLAGLLLLALLIFIMYKVIQSKTTQCSTVLDEVWRLIHSVLTVNIMV